jgi:two-component system response regulator DesR
MAIEHASPLTPREREVLLAASRDFTTKQTAFFLGCATGTVRSHKQNALISLHVHSTAAAVARALREGWIS